jgi:drug/metabolite transporter (DMT)-like permease
VIVGAVLGAAGIGAMFLPEIRGQAFNQGALVGLAFCIAGTLSFCLGNLVSWSAQRRGLPVVSTNAWGMVYGAILLALYCLLRGLPLQVDWSVRYLGSLLWLSLTASVVAFATYLTLLGRIGSGRAGYATVMFPVVALAISAAVEGYHPGLLAALGLLLVLGGNALVLSRRS